MLIDHHCHLDFPELAAARADILARAAEAGVAVAVTISTRVSRFPEILAIAEANDNVYCSVGTHPHYAHEEPDVGVDDLIRILNGERIGRRVAFDVLRRGQLRSFDVMPLERPVAKAA